MTWYALVALWLGAWLGWLMGWMAGLDRGARREREKPKPCAHAVLDLHSHVRSATQEGGVMNLDVDVGAKCAACGVRWASRGQRTVGPVEVAR